MALPPALVSELRATLASFRAAHGTVAVPGGADEAEDQIAPGDLGEDGRDSPGKGGPSEEC